MRRILIAPACFKGSLSAPAVAAIMRDVLKAHLPADVALDVCPVADGGDDTLAVLQAADPGFVVRQAQVTGPVAGMKVTADYLVHSAKRLVVIEAAQAHGLKLLPPQALAPLEATSYGVGELIRHAITTASPPPETILVALGGSASTDGGMGALQALGVRFLDAQGRTIREPINGRLLDTVHGVEWLPRWAFSGRILIATDVVNPLLGPDGAAMVFAPQKGATLEQCRFLEKGLAHIGQIVRKARGQDNRSLPGVGAAGGLAYGLRHLPRVGLVSGSQWIANQLDLLARIHAADLIMTGEGRFDATSFGGKATGNILAWAGEKPIVLICGQSQETLTQLAHVECHTLASDVDSVEEAMAQPESVLRQVIQRLLPALLARLA